MNYQEELKGKFNAALIKLERIGELKKGCVNARLGKDYHRWFELLRCWRSELNERMRKHKYDMIADTYEELIDVSFNIFKVTKVTPYFAGKTQSISPPITSFLLNRYELWLGYMEYKFGISIPDHEDPRWAAGN